MKPEEIAELFKKGFDCSQVVLAQYAEKLGVSEEEAYKMSSCFGGGMGAGGSCGAIVGAMIALGLKYGQYDVNHMEQKDIMAAKRGEFFAKIQDKYPSCACRDILGYDLTNPEEVEKILEEGLLFTLCPVVVSDVIDALDSLI